MTASSMEQQEDDLEDLLQTTSDDTDDDSQEETFSMAADHLQTIHQKLPSTDLLEMYALYKQATVGKCNTSKPGILNIQGRSKWDAWNALGEMSAGQAKKMYVAKLKTLDKDGFETIMMEKKTVNGMTGKRRRGWVRPSIPKALNEEPHKTEEEKDLLDFVREGNFERVQEHLLDRDAPRCFQQLTALDENGMALIHWACDRNHVEVLRLLVAAGTPVDLRDGEQQTALHYACSCGHLECARVLLEQGADASARDQEGQTCREVAPHDDLKLLTLLSTWEQRRNSSK